MSISKKVNQMMQQEDWENFNKDPFESAKKEALVCFTEHVQDMQREIKIFSTALEGKFANPSTDQGREIKKSMEQFITEDEAALRWVDNQTDDPAVLVLIASRLDRFADFSLSFAKMELGEERIFQEIKGLAESEQLSVEEGGRISYSANILRNYKTEGSKG